LSETHDDRPVEQNTNTYNANGRVHQVSIDCSSHDEAEQARPSTVQYAR
jgi:hypothetical protein